MELRRLRYFAVLAKRLHFGRAAEEIGIAQPGLSQQIKVLERELGTELLCRDGREVRLTAAGEELAAGLPSLLNRCDALERSVRAAARGTRGVLRVAYTRSAADLHLGELVRAFRAAGDVEIEALTGWTGWNLELLRDDEVDVAFVRGPVCEEGVEVRELGAEELAVALPEGHRLTVRTAVPVEELAHEPVVLWPRHQGVAFYDRLLEQVWPGREPQVVQEEPESEQMLSAVVTGVGLSVLGRRRAEKLCPPGVELRPFAPPAPRMSVSAAWRRGEDSALVRDFVRFLSDRAPQHLLPQHVASGESLAARG